MKRLIPSSWACVRNAVFNGKRFSHALLHSGMGECGNLPVPAQHVDQNAPTVGGYTYSNVQAFPSAQKAPSRVAM